MERLSDRIADMGIRVTLFPFDFVSGLKIPKWCRFALLPVAIPLCFITAILSAPFLAATVLVSFYEMV